MYIGVKREFEFLVHVSLMGSMDGELDGEGPKCTFDKTKVSDTCF